MVRDQFENRSPLRSFADPSSLAQSREAAKPESGTVSRSNDHRRIVSLRQSASEVGRHSPSMPVLDHFASPGSHPKRGSGPALQDAIAKLVAVTVKGQSLVSSAAKTESSKSALLAEAGTTNLKAAATSLADANISGCRKVPPAEAGTPYSEESHTRFVTHSFAPLASLAPLALDSFSSLATPPIRRSFNSLSSFAASRLRARKYLFSFLSLRAFVPLCEPSGEEVPA